ncbi:restriction endonuclease subunit S [Brevibacillus choshinensis]|nr:restriction endonuclease subunit S [Brevibacillus choshinensis]
MKNNNTPEIRFPGFTGEWEERKLGEIYTERKERGYDSLQILSVSIHHGVSNEELDSNTLGKKVRRSEDKSLYKHVYFGDLVLNMMRAWQGAIGVVKSEGMVSPAYITAIPSAQLYPLFMDYCLRRDETINQMDNLSYGVTDFRKRLYWDSFINVMCRIPSVPEQERITAFFTHLDNLITLHQQELTTLKQTKQGFLQKMFPKEGESLPEVRFPGFTGDWEQIRLGDRATIKGRLGWKSLKQEEYISDGPSMIAGKHINNGVIDWSAVDHIPQWRYDESPEIMLKNGDVIFSKDGSLGNPALISGLNISATINSTMMLVRVDETIDPSFFYQVMKSEKFERLIYLKVSGSSIPHLFQADMNEFMFLAPVKEEQIKIGNFFKQLDDTIALHQRELDALKETKKAFLQKMFV